MSSSEARLHQLRRKRNVTQEELAHRVGRDVSYLSELENGRKEPCLRKMKEITKGLGITLSELLRGSERGLISSEGA